MKKMMLGSFAALILSMLSGCGFTGDKTAGVLFLYAAAAILALILLVSYCLFIRRKNIWFLLMYVSVLVVNIGYLSLSLSATLEEALLANRIAYLGSVFLPMSFFLIISEVCGIRIKKYTLAAMFGISVAVFLIAASPGYLDIYYKDAVIEWVNGAARLKKTYGPLHVVYLIYLLAYFSSMIYVITASSIKKKDFSTNHKNILLFIVFWNIAIWFIEQFVDFGFELLSVSYVVTEVFLLLLYSILQEYRVLHNEQTVAADKSQAETISQEPPKKPEVSPEQREAYEFFSSNLPTLTLTEKRIFDLYIKGKGSKEIMEELNIKETTLKYHNRNIYGKLGVASRKQMIEYAIATKSYEK